MYKIKISGIIGKGPNFAGWKFDKDNALCKHMRMNEIENRWLEERISRRRNGIAISSLLTKHIVPGLVSLHGTSVKCLLL